MEEKKVKKKIPTSFFSQLQAKEFLGQSEGREKKKRKILIWDQETFHSERPNPVIDFPGPTES